MSFLKNTKPGAQLRASILIVSDIMISAVAVLGTGGYIFFNTEDKKRNGEG